jgi:hypothetical protein
MKQPSPPAILLHPAAHADSINYARLIGRLHRAVPQFDHNKGKARRLKARLNRRLTERRISK